jgi:lysophospholipase L1-like esterase
VGKRSMRRLVVVAAGAVLLAGCGPLVFILGDSQVGVASDAAGRAFNSDYLLALRAKPSCGLLPNANPQCPGPVDWRAEYNDMVEKKGTPKVVIVELGTNDAANYTETVISLLEPQAIRDFVSNIPSDVPVVWSNIPAVTPSWDPTIDTRIQAVNTALAQVDGELSQLQVVDVRSFFADHFPEWFGSDQWHFNQTGSEQYAAFMCHSLDGLHLTDGTPKCDPTTTTTEPATTTTEPPTTTSTESSTTTTTVPEETTTTAAPAP